MWRRDPLFLILCLAALALAGCGGAPVASRPLPVSAADFARWTCAQVQEEQDLVQRKAIGVAYRPDSAAGDGMLNLAGGLSVYWPALLAMRPAGMEARDLSRLKLRFDALGDAVASKACGPVVPQAAAPARQSGDRLVYESRSSVRGPTTELALRATASGAGRVSYVEGETGRTDATAASGTWTFDTAGNLSAAPNGALWWPSLLRSALTLGQVTAGDIMLSGDPHARARMRGQIVAVGEQNVAGQRFDAAVLELFGDAPSGDAYTRVEGVLVVDRAQGTLVRLELFSAHAAFNVHRRLLRVELAPR